VIGASWLKYFVENIGIGTRIQVGDSEYKRLLTNLEIFMKELVINKKKVFLVFNIPSDKELDPKFFLYRNLKTPKNFFQIRSQGIATRKIEATIGQINKDLLTTATRSGAEVINPFKFLCKSSFCPNISKDGKPIYSDRLHLNPNFVRTQAVFLDPTVQTN
jgi:hypothetical protein